MGFVRACVLVAFAMGGAAVVAACGLDFDKYEPGASAGDSSVTDSPVVSPDAPSAVDVASSDGERDAEVEADVQAGVDAADAPAGEAGPCGGPGEPCCTGSTCAGGGCCNASTCLAPGESNGSGGVCVDGMLVTCGGAGQPCCQNGACGGQGCCVDGTCIAAGKTCGGTGLGTCTNGACGCGGDGQTCCKGSPNGGWNENFCTASGEACNPAGGTCTACGGTGQPCCDGLWCGGGGCCDRSTRTCTADGAMCGGGQGACSSGACGGGTCGGEGLTCCGNNVECTAPYTSCQMGTCAGCGGNGEPCCIGNNTGGYWCSVGLGCTPGRHVRPVRRHGTDVLRGGRVRDRRVRRAEQVLVTRRARVASQDCSEPCEIHSGAMAGVADEYD